MTMKIWSALAALLLHAALHAHRIVPGSEAALASPDWAWPSG